MGNDITPEMIRAGMEVFRYTDRSDGLHEEMIAAIYEEMHLAACSSNALCRVIPQPRTGFLVGQKLFGQKGIWVIFHLDENQQQAETRSSRILDNQAELIGLAFSIVKMVLLARAVRAKAYWRSRWGKK